MTEKIVKNPPEENTVIFAGFYEDSGEIENLVIPEGMVEIGENAFRGFASIRSVTLPKSMKRISACAFAGCENLERVMLNYGLEEILDEATARDEYVMLRLRLSDGVDKREFFARFGQDFDAVYGKSAAPFVKAGLLSDTDERIAFTDRGFSVSNTVLSELLF